MKIKAIAHVCLRAKELEPLLRFYRDMLELEPAFNFTKDGRMAGFYLKIANGMFLEAFQAADASGERCCYKDDRQGKEPPRPGPDRPVSGRRLLS